MKAVHPKVAYSGFTGILTAFILYELNGRFHLSLAPEEAAFVTVLVTIVAGYLTPASDNPVAPVEEDNSSVAVKPSTEPMISSVSSDVSGGVSKSIFPTFNVNVPVPSGTAEPLLPRTAPIPKPRGED